MNTSVNTIIFIIICFLSLIVIGNSEARANDNEDGTLKLLTVGNSFSQNACQYLKDLAKAGGHKLVLGHADIGGCPLDKHFALALIAETEPDNPAGKPYGTDWSATPGKKGANKSLKEVLLMDKWDIITIQQYSWISDDYNTYQPHGQNLYDYIKRYAPDAEIVVHETWAYRYDDPRYADGKDSQKKMYTNLRNAYQKLASDLKTRLIPVGDAFFAADTDKNWAYEPVEPKVSYPDLPDQTHSLHVGWYWSRTADGNHRLDMDAHHASALGCYLAGSVWYEFLFNESVENNSFVPKEISKEDADYLRKTASKIMRKHRK